jgi:hypothetical protein
VQASGVSRRGQPKDILKWRSPLHRQGSAYLTDNSVFVVFIYPHVTLGCSAWEVPQGTRHAGHVAVRDVHVALVWLVRYGRSELSWWDGLRDPGGQVMGVPLVVAARNKAPETHQRPLSWPPPASFVQLSLPRASSGSLLSEWVMGTDRERAVKPGTPLQDFEKSNLIWRLANSTCFYIYYSILNTLLRSSEVVLNGLILSLGEHFLAPPPPKKS